MSAITEETVGGGFRFSKSSHDWEDLLSHLNLYNPMNISLGDNTFTATVHATKMEQRADSAQLHFCGIVSFICLLCLNFKTFKFGIILKIVK